MWNQKLCKWLLGDQDGTAVEPILISDIDYSASSDPVEGVMIATLATNMLKFGQLQPVLVRKDRSGRSYRYRLIAGRRRMEALRMLGKTTVRALVVSCSEDDIGLLSLSDNLLHCSPNCFAVSDAICSLQADGYDEAQLERLLGVSRADIVAYNTLQSYSSEVKRLLVLSGATTADAFAMAKVPECLRVPLLERVIAEHDLSVRWLVEEYLKNPIASVLQCHKFWSSDLRLFSNSIKRCVDTARQSGVDCILSQHDLQDGLRFVIDLKGMPPAHSRSVDLSKNVSRETFCTDEECLHIE